VSTSEGEIQGSVGLGDFTLQVGGAGGTVVQKSAGAAAEGTGTLAQALAEPQPQREGKAAAAAGAVEDAAAVTTQIERAVALGKGVAEGRELSPDQLFLEAGALLDLLERLDRKGRHKEALRLARALATLLMLLRRWTELLRTLRTALRLAESLGDLDAVGWAKNELGALRLAAGDAKGAERCLHEAGEIRERIGDRRGLATTTRNLQCLCEKLQEMVRKDELVRRTREETDSMLSKARRPSLLQLFLLAVLCALFFAGGVLAGNSGGSGNRVDFESGAGGHGNNHSGGGNDNGGSGSGNKAGTGPYTLTIAVEGEGSGTVEGSGIICEKSCEEILPAGTEVSLFAHYGRGTTFAGFTGDCEGETCALILDEPMSVTATFDTAEISTSSSGGTTTEEPEEPVGEPEEPAEESEAVP
jgi:Divergent InlB B-repeat domain